jgi:hypothetical protein
MEEHNENHTHIEEAASESIYPNQSQAKTTCDSGTVEEKPARIWKWRFNCWHLACAALILVLFIYLGVRASDEDRWSDWGFGDAQTLLSLKQWNENGWAANYFLFIPQGYAKVIQIFDDQQLRHHAHGDCPGSSPRIAPRLWYTHYPAGYLVPYAAMFATGLQTKFAAQMLSIVFSLLALMLMYATFARITGPAVSFFATLFYAVSRPFLNYADTLANQPLDDLLRFGFMLAVVLSTRSESDKSRRRWMIAAWVLEFALSLSSFDSVFFLFVWLVGWDLLERRGFRWKIWFIYGMAPVTAHGLQFLQNVWYLGFNDAVIDIKDAFILKNGGDAGYNKGVNRLTVIVGTFWIVFKGIIYNLKLLWAMLIAYLGYILFLKDRNDKTLPSAGLLLLLFFSGLSFMLILPHAARMPYEARQMLPLVSLIVAGLTVATIKTVISLIRGETPVAAIIRKKGSALFVIVAIITLLLTAKECVTVDRTPIYPPQLKYMPDFKLAKILGEGLKSVYEPVIFDIDGFQLFWGEFDYVPGYPQIMPLTEFYAGSRPILCFRTAESLAMDLIYLLNKSPYRFSPIITSTNRGLVYMVLSIMEKNGALNGTEAKIYNVMDNYLVVDLSESVRWGGQLKK